MAGEPPISVAVLRTIVPWMSLKSRVDEVARSAADRREAQRRGDAAVACEAKAWLPARD